MLLGRVAMLFSKYIIPPRNYFCRIFGMISMAYIFLMIFRLKEYSEKLIFLNPVDLEERLRNFFGWKVFYSVISAVKKSKKV